MNIEMIYLKAISSFLEEITQEEFLEWKNIDKYGNPTPSVQFKEDLRKELEKAERYDLLLLL
jgi:hypothetical protein